MKPASPALSNRAICYCDDCQAFAHHIGRSDLLDAKGGSDLIQAPPSSVSFTQGQDQVLGLRLTPRGLFRFRAACCNTPMGYAVSPAIPFVGLTASSFRAAGSDPDREFGPPRAKVKGQYAIGPMPPGSKGFPVGFLIAAVARVLGWRFGGRTWPHPLFDRTTHAPIYPVAVLPAEQRAKLRADFEARRAAA